MNYLLPATGNKIHFKSRFFHTCVRPPVTKWLQAGQPQWKRRPRILHVHKVWRLVVKTYMVSWTGHVANSSLNSRPGTAMFFFYWVRNSVFKQLETKYNFGNPRGFRSQILWGHHWQNGAKQANCMGTWVKKFSCLQNLTASCQNIHCIMDISCR